MKTLPVEFSKQISVFAPLFSKKVFEHAKLLLPGCVLGVGKRTACGCLHTLGMGNEKRFHKYHRVLNLAKWSGLRGSEKLLQLMVDTFFRPGQPLVFGIDESLERRWGRKIKARAIYRYGVRSSGSHFAKSSGLHWMCLMLLSPIPWAGRIWALRFFTALCPSERFYKNKAGGHKKLTDWAWQMIIQLHPWLPKRKIIVVADSSYHTYELLHTAESKVCMISRLRLNARLFDFPLLKPKGKRGPAPIVGPRQPKLANSLEDLNTQWNPITLSEWYGQKQKKLLFISKKAIWYKSGMSPVSCRWVLIKDPEGKAKLTALICTNLEMTALEIIQHFFVKHWGVEVTFEEVRKHLDVETQRQWSDLAIARTPPVLMALFSLVTLWAHQLNETQPIVA